MPVFLDKFHQVGVERIVSQNQWYSVISHTFWGCAMYEIVVISLPGFFVGILDDVIRVATIGVMFFHIFGMFLEVSVFRAVAFDA